MVGEIRDLETAEMAIQAALTGHLVLSTLHTNDAPSTITRLLDLGMPSYLLNVDGARRNGAAPGARAMPAVQGTSARSRTQRGRLLVAPWKAHKPEMAYVAKGCLDCRMTGYVGRVGIYEMMVLNNEIRNMINDKTDMDRLRESVLSRRHEAAAHQRRDESSGRRYHRRRGDESSASDAGPARAAALTPLGVRRYPAPAPGNPRPA